MKIIVPILLTVILVSCAYTPQKKSDIRAGDVYIVHSNDVVRIRDNSLTLNPNFQVARETNECETEVAEEQTRWTEADCTNEATLSLPTNPLALFYWAMINTESKDRTNVAITLLSQTPPTIADDVDAWVSPKKYMIMIFVITAILLASVYLCLMVQYVFKPADERKAEYEGHTNSKYVMLSNPLVDDIAPIKVKHLSNTFTTTAKKRHTTKKRVKPSKFSKGGMLRS